MMVKPVTFSELFVGLLVNLRSIPEVSEFDWNITKLILQQLLSKVYYQIIYYRNFYLALMKYCVFIIRNHLVVVCQLTKYIIFHRYSLNDYFQFIWLASHILTIGGTVGYYYGLNEYHMIIISAIVTYILLTIKHCQILFNQCWNLQPNEFKIPPPPVPPKSAISVRTIDYLWEQSSQHFNIPTSLPMSSEKNELSISDVSSDISLPTIQLPPFNPPTTSPFTLILQSENTHVLGMLCLLLTTTASPLKLVSINIYSWLNIVNLILSDIFPNHTFVELVQPLFQFLELKCLKFTIVVDLLINILYFYEYFHVSHQFYPIPIYFMISCLRFENSLIFQQVILQFLQFQMEMFQQFPFMVNWFNGIKIFLYLNNQINS